ncbi:MAG: MarR family transcriptional regulator, partial [Cyclonatronaceae bacterium]
MEKQELLHQLINAYAEAYQNLGHSSLMGKIVALLIASPEPLSLDDISEQLQMSKGPVSQIARKLK